MHIASLLIVLRFAESLIYLLTLTYPNKPHFIYSLYLHSFMNSVRTTWKQLLRIEHSSIRTVN